MPRLPVIAASGLAAALWIGLAAGCDRGQNAGQPSDPGRNEDRVEPAQQKPEYSFAAGLEEEFPEVVGFLRRFMETALAGDYAEYRRLVSRVADPESKARFTKVLNSLLSLRVESIEELDLPELPPAAYLVISRVELDPDRKVALRRGNRSGVAILVFEEEGELRMMFAPAELQPPEAEDMPTSVPTTTSAPSYPWDQDGDY